MAGYLDTENLKEALALGVYLRIGYRLLQRSGPVRRYSAASERKSDRDSAVYTLIDFNTLHTAFLPADLEFPEASDLCSPAMFSLLKTGMQMCKETPDLP